VAKALKRHGATHLFTLCGGHIQAIYDGCLDEDIRVVDVRHEQTAGHAADGYARVTGRPGVCAVTAGPGVTDVVTSVANALRAGSPMIVLGGAGPRALSDMGSLQDMDAVTLMRPVTKWSVQVPEVGRIIEYVDAAFRVAMANVPGPVFLELPLDLLMNVGDDEALPATYPARSAARPGPDPDALAQAEQVLALAERPVFLVGSQIRWSPQRASLESFATAIGAPFFLNGMARGGLSHANPLRMSRSRRFALARTDAAFVFGTPFDFRVDYGRAGTWAADAKIVQVDLDGAELGRNRRVDVALHADSGLVLQGLARSAQKQKRDRSAWVSAVRADEEQKQAGMLAATLSRESPPHPLFVCAEVSRRLGPSDIVVGDGGDFVATAAYVLKIEWPQVWMDPGPLGTLGVGPGYAMAAKLARPDARVVVMYGDGAFGLHALEFEAMVRQNIPVIAIIGNDAAWTQIRRGQVELYGEERAVATALSYARYDEIVRAVGGFGAWVTESAELEPALDQAFASGRPACVNVKLGASDFRKGAISV
jgi:acetolactate synthase-1/2/3 large subunit